ncbi:MAG: ABC transporter permease [Acidobacteria bacterium]|nr:ABC transporter permease [Acidobacteriota bacterium]MBK8151317.1 ABC transporter permease [Acidobacteriota bacterium]MBK8810093.1 ABC transporter permease [Acidobacteriota bacterium]
MPFLEALKLAFASILSHKLRSFLTLLGVIFGVATVIVVVALVEGFNAYVDEKIANIGTNAFSVQKFSIDDFSSVEVLNAARRRNRDVTFEDLKALQTAGGSIRDAGGKSGTIADIKFGDKTLSNVQVKATTPNVAEIEKIEAAEGRYFANLEDETRKFVCFIGSETAEKLFPKGDALGQTIKIDGRTFKVVGVGKALGSAFGQTRDMYASVPLSTFLSIYGIRRTITASVTSTSPATYDLAIDEARTLMRVRRKLEPGEADNFGIVTPSAINGLRDKIFGTIQIAAIGVTSISLVVGGIVIMNIMLVSVTERTKEIGIRKSIGARRFDIVKQFLAESTTLALIGGAIGIGIAYAIAKLVALLFSIPTSLPLLWVAIALTVSSSVGLISGVFPAWKAAGLDPIEALRAD